MDSPFAGLHEVLRRWGPRRGRPRRSIERRWQPRKSSAALKREDIWPALEKAVRESPDIDTLTMLWDDKAEESSRWPQTWRDAWWDMVEARTKELEGKRAAE